MAQPNLYEFLEVPRDASPEQINKAFREKALVLHPDKNKTDPNAARKFMLLTQAYQVLTDSNRRKKYDATLPSEPAQQHVTDPQQLWQLTAKLFFEQSERFTPAVDALRLSRALAIEDESLLVACIEPANASLIGYLNAAITYNHVRRILTELYGKSLDFRIISGSSLADWQMIKEAEEKVRKRRAGGRTVADVQAVTDTASLAATTNPDEIWDSTMEILARNWSATESRAYPQVRARYLLEQLPVIARAEDISRAAGNTDDTFQRSLARALERLASVTGVDVNIVALEYIRYRARVLGGI